VLRPNRYLLLLIVVLAHLTTLALQPPFPWVDLTNLFAAALFGALLYQVTGRPRDGFIMFALGCGGSLLNLLLPWGHVSTQLDLLKVSFWDLAPAFLAWRMLGALNRKVDITREEIAGAVTVYMLLGLIFANIFEAMLVANPQALVFGAPFHDQPIRFGEVLYFSFSTLCTVGYGDVSPGLPQTRVVAVTESVTGVMFISILVARFVSIYSARHAREASRGNGSGSPRD
jgi:hypothetical protein